MPDRRSILLVDDDQATRQAMAKLLIQDGFKVIAVGSIPEALPKLGNQNYLILDVHLPDGLGLTVLRAAHRNHPNTKVAVCTGATDVALLRAVALERPDVLLRKPIDMNTLTNWLAS